MSVPAAQRTVLILGAGPGTGASLAHAFARAGHPVALASRTLPAALADEINAAVPQPAGAAPLARAWSVDAARSADVARFVADAHAAWPGARPWAGIWNPTAGFGMRKYLDWSEEHVREAFEVQVIGAHTFSQALLRIFLAAEAPADVRDSRGVLLYSGATSALRGSEMFAGFAAAKAGLRMLSQSIAREHGRDGVHSAHIIIDGLIDTERVSKMAGPAKGADQRIQPDHLAAEYLHLAYQPRGVWTQELDLRPAPEKF